MPLPFRSLDAFDAEKPIGAIFLAALPNVNIFEPQFGSLYTSLDGQSSTTLHMSSKRRTIAGCIRSRSIRSRSE
jgi:hypothetical protein